MENIEYRLDKIEESISLLREIKVSFNDVVKERKEVILTSEDHRGMQEEWQHYFVCNCGYKHVASTHNYCPDCGSKITLDYTAKSKLY